MDLVVKVLLSSGICFSIFSSLVRISEFLYANFSPTSVRCTHLLKSWRDRCPRGLLLSTSCRWSHLTWVRARFIALLFSVGTDRLEAETGQPRDGERRLGWVMEILACPVAEQTEFRRPLMQSWWVILSNCVLYFRFGWQGESATRRKAKSGEEGKSEAKWGVESRVSVTISRVWRHIR